MPIAILLFACLPHVQGSETITNVAGLVSAVYTRPEVGTRFSFTATATKPQSDIEPFFTVSDGTGSIYLVSEPENGEWIPVAAGDRIHVDGLVQMGKRSRLVYASCRHIGILGHGTAPLPRDCSIGEMLSGRHDNEYIRIRGIVKDAFADEIDANYLYMTITADGKTTYAAFRKRTVRLDRLRALIGSEIVLSGACYLLELNTRRQIGRTFHASANDPIRLIRSAADNPFDVPLLGDHPELQPDEVSRLDRHRVIGRVNAVWEPDHVLLETPDRRIVGITLGEDRRPNYGEIIEAVGFPSADPYRINLTQAIWRPSSARMPFEQEVADIDIQTFLSDRTGGFRYQPHYHGKGIRLQGLVLSMPVSGIGGNRLYMRCGQHIVPVDTSSCPSVLNGLVEGCVIEATGTCIMESEGWQPNSAFPRIRNFAIVVRKPADIRIISRPPWLTIAKLLAIVAALLATLVGIFAWNIALRRLATRKGRELFKEQLGHVKADLRTEERTRLAVELHDTLAQNLTGVSMEIEAANDLRGDAPQPMLDHLGIAAKALKSCRDELRNCLWDLRSQALEEPDMTKAVLKTLQPVVNDSRLAVRFNVPRARLSDNTAHALLRVIRELVVNAIRHGNASAIKVAGTIDNGKLLCSVTDDGCGFDPDTAPGVLQGHFGLQGIQERVDELGGTFEISSLPGKGTKAVITLTAPTEEQQ